MTAEDKKCLAGILKCFARADVEGSVSAQDMHWLLDQIAARNAEIERRMIARAKKEKVEEALIPLGVGKAT